MIGAYTHIFMISIRVCYLYLSNTRQKIIIQFHMHCMVKAIEHIEAIELTVFSDFAMDPSFFSF